MEIELRQVATRDETQTRCSLSEKSQSIRTKRLIYSDRAESCNSQRDSETVGSIKYSKNAADYLQLFTFTFLRSAMVDMIDEVTYTLKYTRVRTARFKSR